MRKVFKKTCSICHGEGWVCEDHQDRPWNKGAGHIYRDRYNAIKRCDGAGAPCRGCNATNPLYRQPSKRAAEVE